MKPVAQRIPPSLRLRAGELVEVRSEAEILATLDENGCLDGLPFMPEMLRHCGQQFRVSTRAHKCCDTIHKTGNRRMKRVVNLEGSRCDGADHDGCQAWCLLIWKDAWLRRAGTAPSTGAPVGDAPIPSADALQRSSRFPPAADDPRFRYRCQTTELFRATSKLRWWDPRFYFEDLTSGNVRLRDMAAALTLRSIFHVLQLGRGHRLLRGLYNRIANLRGGPPYPYNNGGPRDEVPSADLGLQAGEVVRVKSQEDILETLAGWKNRGLLFDPEMVPHCGRKFRVRQRVERIICEHTGVMLRIKRDCIMLDGTFCGAELSGCRLFCSRAIPAYWREVWLERCAPGEEPDPPRGKAR